MIVFSVQIKCLRHWEIKLLAPEHTARKCQRWVSNLGLSVSRALALNHNPRPRPSPHSKFFQKLPFTSKHYSIKNFTVDDIFLVGCVAFFFFFFLVLPVYCYQPITLQPHAHMLRHVTPWTAACQAPLSMDFSRQEYWSGLPFPSPGSDAFMYH